MLQCHLPYKQNSLFCDMIFKNHTPLQKFLQNRADLKCNSNFSLLFKTLTVFSYKLRFLRKSLLLNYDFNIVILFFWNFCIKNRIFQSFTDFQNDFRKSCLQNIGWIFLCLFPVNSEESFQKMLNVEKYTKWQKKIFKK